VQVTRKHTGRAVSAASLCIVLASMSLPSWAHAKSLFVSAAGSDDDAGDEQHPFASLQKAQSSAAPGDTVYIRGGSYKFVDATAADGVLLNKSGTADAPIVYEAYRGERPVFDFSGMTALLRITGIRVTASYVRIKGLELTGVPQRINTANESWGIYNLGSGNVYEALDIHHIDGPGLFIGGGSDNVVLNCDSHHNYDPMSKAGPGENADGFGCHGSGSNNVFRGCRAWWNTDDGFDFISAKGTCVVERSWAFYNGYLPDTFTAQSNGNGFKAGGYGTGTVPAAPPRHTVRLCVAFRNRAAGFYANHHPIGGDWFGNTGYKNARDFDMLVLEGGTPNHKLRNNLAYAGSSAIANFTGKDDAANSWSLPVMSSDADFLSVDLKQMEAPRKPDGSLPDVSFLHLKADSDLIDKGLDVGLPFAGKAPDLGAFETGLSAVDPGAADAGAGSHAADGGGVASGDPDGGVVSRDGGTTADKPRDAGKAGSTARDAGTVPPDAVEDGSDDAAGDGADDSDDGQDDEPQPATTKVRDGGCALRSSDGSPGAWVFVLAAVAALRLGRRRARSRQQPGA
jgi:MYXO-CTERM domain-containing protein